VTDDLMAWLVSAARIAIQQASAAAQTTTAPATVVAIAGAVATVHVDGDPEGRNIEAAVVSKLPVAGDRVVVQFIPPHAVYVLGRIGGFA